MRGERYVRSTCRAVQRGFRRLAQHGQVHRVAAATRRRQVGGSLRGMHTNSIAARKADLQSTEVSSTRHWRAARAATPRYVTWSSCSASLRNLCCRCFGTGVSSASSPLSSASLPAMTDFVAGVSAMHGSQRAVWPKPTRRQECGARHAAHESAVAFSTTSSIVWKGRLGVPSLKRRRSLTIGPARRIAPLVRKRGYWNNAVPSMLLCMDVAGPYRVSHGPHRPSLNSVSVKNPGWVDRCACLGL